MAYIDKELMFARLREAATTKYDWSEQIDVEDFEKIIKEMPTADVVDSAWAKALEKDIEIIENKIIKVEGQRDALLEELQRLADCSSCKFNTPDAVDGCSTLMPCKDGSMWEWKGVKNEI